MKLLSKRVTPVLVAGVATALLLAGCSGSGSPSAPASTPGAKPKVAGTIQLSYWGSSTRVAKYDQINDLFEKKYPNAKVQASAGDFGTYFDKLNVQAASKTMPCVTTMQTRQLNDYTTNGTMMDLGPLVKSGQIDVSQIPKSVLDTGRGPDGKLYMVPFGVAWNAITINTAMAKQNGIPLLKKGYTWDDYGQWLKTAAAKLPAGVEATDDQGRDEPTFSAYVISHGYKMFNSKGKIGFPKSALEDYWNMWQKYSKAGYTSSPQQNSDEPAQLEQFDVTLGKVLSEQTAGNALPGIQAANPSANMDTAVFPESKSGLGNMFFVSGYSIPTSCDNVATAAAYVNFWTNNDAGAAIFASDNGAVANSKQLKQQIANPPSAGVKTVLQQYQYILSKKVPAQTIPSGYNAVFEQAFTRDYEDVEFGRKSVSAAVDAFFSEANSSLGTK
jgi:multiple sugar transport system substrate-binding protein